MKNKNIVKSEIVEVPKERKKRVYVRPNILKGASLGNISEVAAAVRIYPESALNKNSLGENALHLAVRSGNFTISQFLIEETRVDISQKNKKGQDALDVALEVGHSGIVSMLFKARAEQLGLLEPNDDPGQSTEMPTPPRP